MKRAAWVFSATSFSFAMLAGCGGDMQGASQSFPMVRTASSQVHPTLFNPDRTQVAIRKKYKGLKALYVADLDSIKVLTNGKYKLEATITSGLKRPGGDWLDLNGNLYVTDYSGVDIQEFSPNKSRPSFTYNAGMSLPVSVSTDAKGNVFETDAYGGGLINEYKQRVNTVVATCELGYSVVGVAVDAKGDVFADYYVPDTYFGYIVQYRGGLSGCKATTLGVYLNEAGGMALDRANDLVVCDPSGRDVEVIAPPYTQVTRWLGSGYSAPTGVTISRDNKLAFVSDEGKHVVDIIAYASGTILQTLGSANGLSDPSDAVDGPNAVY